MTIFIQVLCILMFLTFGFLGGICYSAWVMCLNVKNAQNLAFEATRKDTARNLSPRYQHAVGISARCWCDPRTINTPMDTALATIFAEKIAEYIQALQWCGGSDDFCPGGKAYIDFERICRPLMRMNHKIDITKLTREQYKNLSKNAPELLGLRGLRW